MVSKCKKVNKIDDTWLNWVQYHVGDPRASRNEQKWLRIGDEFYQWLRAKLSQVDVRLFLEIMTDGQGDKV
ncbi:MAG: hypothetical protein KGV51_08720 [Moraxellaceae bacterium]|nr:hypothetical protein [Moraxellaceae bacterium]